MPPPSDPAPNNLPGLVLLILCIAVPLAFFASIGVLILYRRAVLQGMRARANAVMTEPNFPDPASLPAEPVRTPLEIAILNPSSSPASDSTSAELYTDLLRGSWRTATVYTAAGLCYALVTTIIFLRATESEFRLLSFLMIFWYYAWPVAVTIALVAAPTWRAKLIVFGTYFGIIFILGIIAVVIGNPVSTLLQILSLWLLTNFPAALLLLAFLNRRIQAVGPLVLTWMIFAATGLVFIPMMVINNERLLVPFVRASLTLGLNPIVMYFALRLFGFILFGLIGWLVLQAIGSWYRRRWMSEQSITLDAIWLLFGIFQSVGLFFEGNFWFLASLLSFAVYRIVAWTAFKLTKRDTALDKKHPNLLVLRVFSLGKRSERLFDVLAMYWRFVGSMRLIAGPDLATTTMEPHEFLDFLSGRLARRFIDNDQTLEHKISQTELNPDFDGQFRVSDFFCHDDTWRMVLSRLVRESDAVIMDLRGFSAQNAGCVFEINELINLMPLGQVVFIVDSSTDEAFLRQVLQQSWEHMSPRSPNRLENSGQPKLFRLGRFGTAEVKRLLQALSAAVKPSSEVQMAARPAVAGSNNS